MTEEVGALLLFVPSVGPRDLPTLRPQQRDLGVHGEQVKSKNAYIWVGASWTRHGVPFSHQNPRPSSLISRLQPSSLRSVVRAFFLELYQDLSFAGARVRCFLAFARSFASAMHRSAELHHSSPALPRTAQALNRYSAASSLSPIGQVSTSAITV